ncbi:unnamed protein product [Hyaloperonospora brassicae]|uniref:FAD-binding PCMH-type domain-containing protein n=1 Tax=Hyaloperonospora brassicae TaxID=162125 RepID=A0AAV0T277_HYABA|nr:unnamed protein product [Hyaloperonospora brassicae]
MVATVLDAGRLTFALCSFIVALGGMVAAQSAKSSLATSGPSLADVSACLNKAGIEYSTPTTSTWTVDTEAWNSRVSPVPSAVAFPKTEEEVSAALKCAASCGVKVTTLGGNRSFSSMGFGRNDGALIMNLKHLRHTKYDASTQLLSYGGPVTISDAVNFLWNKHKRSIVHGRCPEVGMTGVAASGFGTKSRVEGTVLDNLVSVRVALANSSIVDADAKQNSQLFWGIRGAASSLGVVLDFKVKTIAPPSKSATNYTIVFDKEYKPTQQDSVDALIGTQTWALSKDNDDRLSIRFALKKNIDAMKLTTTESDFWTSEDWSTPGLVKQTESSRRFFYVTSVTIPGKAPLTNSTAWDLFTNTVFTPKLPDAALGGYVDVWGGKFTKTVRPDDSAWKHDDILLLIRWDMRTPDYKVSFAESSLNTMRTNFYKFVDSYKASGGVPGGFTTYRDEKWTTAEMAEYLYGGGNYAKLQKIKTEYDPNDMFNTDPQAIRALKKTTE